MSSENDRQAGLSHPVGQRVRELLGDRTPAWLAKEIGVSPSTLSGFEQRGLPKVELAIAIALLFDVSLDWLLLGKGSKEPSEPTLAWSQTHASNVRRYIDLAPGPFEDIASRTQITPARLAAIREGRRVPTLPELGRLATAIGAPIQKLVAPADPSEDVTVVRQFDTQVAAGTGYAFEENEPTATWSFPTQWLDSSFGRAARLVLVQVRGDSQVPDLLPGSALMVDLNDKRADAGYFVVRLGSDLLVKRLHVMPSEISLLSTNPNYPPLIVRRDGSDDWEIVGRAVWAGRLL